MDLEGAGGRKGFSNILAGVSLVAIETEILGLRIDLMDEFVIIGEGQTFAPVDGDLAGMKGTTLLDDGMGLVGGECGRWRQQEKQC